MTPPDPATRTTTKGRAGWRGATRAVALRLGGFSLLNLLGDLCYPHFDANLWWIDLRRLPP